MKGEANYKRRTAATIIMVALLFTVVPTAQVGAFHADDLPLLVSGEGAGSGWFSFMVETDGSPFAAEIRLSGSQGGFQGGLLEYHADERFRAGFRGTFMPAENEIDIHEQGTDHVSLLLRDEEGGTPGLGATWNADTSNLVGTYKVILYAVAQEAENHTWSIRGEEGVTIHGVEQGEDAAMYTSRDFDANRHIKVSASTPFAGAGVRHTEDGHRTVDVGQVILGAFGYIGGTGVHENELTAERDGFSRPCPCHMNEIQGSDVWRTGTYTFRASGTAVGVAPEFYLAVVNDPVLPS